MYNHEAGTYIPYLKITRIQVYFQSDYQHITEVEACNLKHEY